MGFFDTVWNIFKRTGYALNSGGNWILGKIFPTKRGRWLDEAKNGLNSRQEILFRDSVTCEIVKNDTGEITVKGVWKCKYTDTVITDPKRIEIDHIVPIAYARANKLGIWTPRKWAEFYNDFSNLRAVEDTINSSKGDKALNKWLPPKNKAWYKKQFTHVCRKWWIRIP